MKEGYVLRDQSKAHFITATVVDWIDVFSRESYKDINMVVNVLKVSNVHRNIGKNIMLKVRDCAQREIVHPMNKLKL